MGLSVNPSRIGKNITLSIAAQFFSLLVSFLLYLIVPKFIDEYQYAYWQTYTLYIGYVGIFHLGLLDGIVLRYSQYDYDNLNKEIMRSQFKTLLLMVSFFAFVGMLIALSMFNGVERTTMILVSGGIITRNLFVYTQYTFQITNRINKYASLIILRNCMYSISIVLLLIAGVRIYYWFCIVDLLCDISANLIIAPFNKGLYFGNSLTVKWTLHEACLNISSGALLLLANWSAILLVGGAKMIIQLRWDELVFGKVSFAFSVTSVFLTFITAISVVLFPSLKRMPIDRLPNMYMSIRSIISPILFIALLLYFPGCMILKNWLPKYAISLKYIGILLPTIVYTSKVTLLTNNYLKAYRKEKTMLYINATSIIIAFILLMICAFILNSLEYVLYVTVVIIVIRSIISEVFVLRIIEKTIVTDFLVEAFMSVLFIICASQFNIIVGLCIYFTCLLMYLFSKRNTLLDCIKRC